MVSLNRAAAEWEMLKKDRVSEPGNAGPVGYLRDGAVKAYNAWSGVPAAALGLISKNEYETVPRTSPIAGTIEGVRSTIHARWFNKGNPLNLVAKTITGLTEVTDGAVRDVLHIGGSKNGYVVKTVD